MQQTQVDEEYPLQHVVIGDKVMPLEVRRRDGNGPKKTHCGFSRRMFSIFRHSRSSKSKCRSIKSAFARIHPVKARPSIHSRRYSSAHEDDPECFHRASGTIFLLAQFFGIFPINNIRAETVRKLSFMKFGPRTIYSYFVLAGITFMTGVSFLHLFKTLNAKSFQTKGGIADATVGAVFYGNSLLGNFMFLRLCPKWISIQYDWRAMERFLDHAGKWRRPALRWRFAIITLVILSIALVEHVLSMISNTPSSMWTNHTFEDFLEVYTNKSHRFIVKNVDYNFTLGIFIFFISKISTFTWNFTDLFLMIVSTGIAERYKYLNQRVLKSAGTQLTLVDWNNLRESYAILSALVKRIDAEISAIILLSFINNIYFICLQLLNGLSPNSSEHPLVNSIYFFGSFIFLIGRTTAVTLLIARINDQCKVILPVLYNCPSINYCIEVQRLQQQITTDDVALTGHKFFSITRNFMLAVSGAIVTYEVVLLQFNVALQRDEQIAS